jgi:DNA-directed RNA polymerase subunit RPC12/RpoP
MSQQNLLERAKQGNPSAIAILINRNFQLKGITAKVSRKDNCLRIMLEADELPNQKNLIEFTRNSILEIGVAEIRILQVFGRQIGDDVPAWSQSIDLTLETSAPLVSRQNPRANRVQNSSSTPAKVVTPTFEQRLKESGVFLFGALGFLVIPVIGWIISAILVFAALGALIQGQKYEGNCPYCSTKVSASLDSLGVNCPACKRRILIKEERFWKIDN